DDLFQELVKQFFAEDFVQILQQGELAGGLEQGERVVVEVQNALFVEAALDELRMNLREGPEIGDAQQTQVGQQLADGGIVGHPERYGRVFEKPARIFLAGGQLAPGGFQGVMSSTTTSTRSQC